MSITTYIYRIIMFLYKVWPFRNYTLKVLRILHVIPKQLQRDLKYRGTFSVSTKKGSFLMNATGHETMENQLFWGGIPNIDEHVSAQLWFQLCEHSKIIMDIGANTGFYSLLSIKTNPEANIFAFEPSRNVFNKLMNNKNLNSHSNMLAYNIALSNQDGTAEFFDYDSPHQYSASLNMNMLPDDQNKIKYFVSTSRLDTFIEAKQLNSVDLMKIDVEMHEPEVLIGMGKYLKAFQPVLLIEVLTDEIGKRIEDILSPLAYLYFNINEVGTPQQVKKITQSGCYNYLICTKQKAKELLLIA